MCALLLTTRCKFSKLLVITGDVSDDIHLRSIFYELFFQQSSKHAHFLTFCHMPVIAPVNCQICMPPVHFAVCLTFLSKQETGETQSIRQCITWFNPATLPLLH